MTIELIDDKSSRVYPAESPPKIWTAAMALIDTPPPFPPGYLKVQSFSYHPNDVIVYARHPDRKMEKILFHHDVPIGQVSELELLMEKWQTDDEIHMAFSVINVRKLMEKCYEFGNEVSLRALYSEYGQHKNWDGTGILGDGLTNAVYRAAVGWIVNPNNVNEVIYEFFGIII